jgi:hypothetical protein
MINFSKYYNNYITKVNFDNNNEILLITINNGYIFKLEAIGDCCSISSFHKYKKEEKDITYLHNKIIKSINKIYLDEKERNEIIKEEELKINKFTFNDFVTPYVYEISFLNINETYKFLMLNYSNGYYNGWIEGSVIKNN